MYTEASAIKEQQKSALYYALVNIKMEPNMIKYMY